MFTLLGGSRGTDSYLGFEPRPNRSSLRSLCCIKGTVPYVSGIVPKYNSNYFHAILKQKNEIHSLKKIDFVLSFKQFQFITANPFVNNLKINGFSVC